MAVKKIVTAIVWRSVEVLLESSGPANVQGGAMETTPQHPGVSQLEPDDINTLLLQQLDQSRLVPIHHDQVRVDAEQVHIDPLAANAPGQVVNHYCAIAERLPGTTAYDIGCFDNLLSDLEIFLRTRSATDRSSTPKSKGEKIILRSSRSGRLTLPSRRSPGEV
jgi:hypothetical protein